MKNLKIEYVDINELKPAEYNPRKANKKQIEDIKKSIERFGLVDPLIVNNAENRKNIVIGGHLRLKVAKEMGYKEVPVVYVNIPDIEKEKELNIRLNKNTGEFDYDLLANFDEDFLKDIGFDEKELNFFVDINDLEIEKEKIKNDKVLELSENLLNFETDNKYDIPKLREDRCLNNVPDNIKIDIASKEGATGNLVLFSKRNYYKGDKSQALLCFYEWDEKFDVFWRETKKIAEEILKDNWFGVITPNWSLYRSDPIAFQIFNTFRSRYIGRYLQELGIKVIPDVNFSDERSYEFCLMGIPKNLNYISIQAQTLNTDIDYYYFQKGVNFILENLIPKNVLVYTASEKVKKILNKFSNVNFIFINTITDESKKKLEIKGGD
jgi:hypothetical protein